jgi:hypothetical protein
MFNLKDLLSKFKEIQDPGEKKRRIAGEINILLGSDLVTSNEIDVRNHVLFLNTHPAIKNKVFLKKKNTIERINNVFPDECIVDIR